MSTKPVSGSVGAVVSLTKNEVRIDAAKLPAAPLVGFANRYAFVQREGYTEWLFWEELDAKTTEPTARVLTPIDDTVDAIWRSFEPLLQRMAPLAAHNDYSRYSKHDRPVRLSGVAAVANVVIMSHAGQDGLITFYHISPRVLALRQTSDPGLVQPVFSVSVPALLIFSVLKEYQKLLPSLRAFTTSMFKR